MERRTAVTTDMRIEYEKSPDWEQYVLLSSDRHLDNPSSDLSLQRFHLDQAKERGAAVLDFGDLFDAMQGKTDKRQSKKDLLARFAAAVDLDEDTDSEQEITRSYLNMLVDYAAQFFEPYVENLALIGEGNHETGVDNKLEYNLLDGLIRDLNRMGNHRVIRGGYRGWIRFMFSNEASKHRMSRTAYYHHGYGGGGPVTKNIIQTNRKAVYLPDADYVFGGHVHEHWIFPMSRVRMTSSGKEIADKQYHVQLPTYKEEYLNKRGGWHHERGGPPKPIGAVWLRFYWSARSQMIKAEFVEAET